MRYKNTDAVPVKEQAKEYIEREALLKKIFPYNAADKKEYTINAYAVEKAIKEAPAADVVEVVHGKWEKTPIDKDIFQTIRCSECGKQALFAFNVNAFGDKELFHFPSEYCPSCGAKMDGERRGNEG